MDQPTHQGSDEARRDQVHEAHYCAFHPGVETGLSCNQCGKNICPKCMVQVPVGARCRECANVQRLPTFDVQPSYYMRASVVSGLVGVVAGLVWGGVAAVFPFSPLAGLLAIGVGYAVGEAVSVSTNRKRGAGLMAVTGAGMLVALLAASLIQKSIFGLVFANYLGLLLLVIGVYTAVNRVR